MSRDLLLAKGAVSQTAPLLSDLSTSHKCSHSFLLEIIQSESILGENRVPQLRTGCLLLETVENVGLGVVLDNKTMAVIHICSLIQGFSSVMEKKIIEIDESHNKC